MYICSVLLYKCYLSVYSPFLLIVEVHSVARLVPVCGEVGLKPCASCVFSHTNAVSLYKSRGKQTIKCTNMCLVSNRPAASSFTDTWHDYTQKSLVTAIVSLGLCEIKKHKRSKRIRLISHISSRGTGSTIDISQHERRWSTMQNLLNIRNDCSQSMCTVKKNSF